MKIGTTIALAGIAALALCGSPAQAQNGRSLNAYLRSLPLQTIDAALEVPLRPERTERTVRVAADQVPRVSGELDAHVVDETGRTVQVEPAVARQKQAQQMIEADEVVHVRV